MGYQDISQGDTKAKPKSRFESKAQSDIYWKNYYDYCVKKYNYDPNKNKAKAAATKKVARTAPVAPAINPYQRLQELYALQSKAAQGLYNSSISQLDTEQAAQKTKIDNVSNDAYQQAYLSNMQQKKEMPQLLAAMGISGGGAESTVSSMQNSYGQSRNKIAAQQKQSISDLEAQYIRLKNQARAQLDKQLNEYDLQYQKSIAGL